MSRALWVCFVGSWFFACPAPKPEPEPDDGSQCRTNADCGDAGLCIPLPGCAARPARICAAAEQWAGVPICGCDGGVVTPDDHPFPQWQDFAACGLDAGEPEPEWQERAWAADYDDAGQELPLSLDPLRVDFSLVGVDGKAACAGRVAALVSARGEFPATQGALRPVLRCGGAPLAVRSWSRTRIEVELPADAPEDCVWLSADSDSELARLRHRCEPEGCEPTPRNRVRRAPVLEASAFGGEGVARALESGARWVYAPGRAHLDWDAGAARVELFADGKRLRPGPWVGGRRVELVAQNECGTTRQAFELSPRPSFSVTVDGGVLLVAADDTAEQDLELLFDAAQFKGSLPPRATLKRSEGVLAVPFTSDVTGPELGRLTVRVDGGVFLEATATVTRPVVRGFADLHVHMFANRGFGGTGFFGAPGLPLDEGLADCRPSHGFAAALDILNAATRVDARLPLRYWGPLGVSQGFPAFRAWPRAHDYTHQQVQFEMLREAWKGGLRLMVLLAVDNQTACRWAPKRAGAESCDDDESMERQLDDARAFAASDAARGWFTLVSTAEEAHRAVVEGKLAVVLGVELDRLGGCATFGKPCDVDALVERLHRAGVRHVFPIHFATNAFGGSANFNMLTTTSEGTHPCEYGRPCNNAGLSELGERYLHALMDRGMLIELDHQSLAARTRTLALAKAAGYPLVSGHAWVGELMQGGHFTEGALTAAQHREVLELGGMVGLLTNQADHLADMRASREPDGGTRVPLACGGSVENLANAILEARRLGGPLAFGSDFNGFAGQPAGRGLVDDRRWACIGGVPRSDWAPAASTLVQYPFLDEWGSHQRTALGARPFDINTDGFAHIGMYPDLLEALRKLGLRQADLEPILTSADAYVQMWERAEQRARERRRDGGP
ncbi:MAG: membrane dipeptidase [Myxococcota bacterium]